MASEISFWSGRYAYNQCPSETAMEKVFSITHPGICYLTRRLNLHHTLDELDAA